MKNNISWKFGIIVALFLIISWHGYATHPLKADFDKLLQDKQATVGVAVVSDDDGNIDSKSGSAARYLQSVKGSTP